MADITSWVRRNITPVSQAWEMPSRRFYGQGRRPPVAAAVTEITISGSAPDGKNQFIVSDASRLCASLKGSCRFVMMRGIPCL